MLERVAVRHLESGGKCLIRGGRLRARALPSSFWTHGTTEIDSSSATLAGLCLDPGECNSSADDPAAPPSLASDGRPESMGLDFLYPAKTLDYLYHLVTATVPRRATSATPFSSMAVRPVRCNFSPARTYATKAGGGVGVRPLSTVHGADGEHAIHTLQDLKDSGLEGKFDLAWNLYHSFFYHRPWERDFLCRYLLNSPDQREHLRLLEFCLSERPYRRTPCMDETICILHLRGGDQAAAWKHLEEVAQRTKEPEYRGFEYYLAYHIEKKEWKEVFRAYALLRSFHGTPYDDTINFPTVFSDMRRSIVPSKILEINRNLAWVIYDWVRALPPPSPTDPFALFIEDVAEDLIKSCLYHFTRWGSLWTPGSEKFWQICHDRNWEVSSSNWQRMLAYLAFNQREDWFIKLYSIYRETQQPDEAKLKILNDVLDILGHRKEFQAMQMVMEDIFLLEEKSRPNRITYNIVMKHLANLGAAAAVEEIFKLYRTRFHAISRAKDFAHLLQAYSKRGEINEVNRWFNDMSEKYRIEPDTLCYNILITAYGKAGDLDAAFFRIEEMLEKGISPDIYSYTSLMEGAANKGDIRTTEGLLDIIQRMTMVPNIRWYRILASCYVKAGQLERARQVIRTVLEDVPDQTPTSVYTVVIAGYVNARRFSEADELFLEMAQLGIPFNNITYGVLMHSLCLNSQPEVAEQTLDYMGEVGLDVTATEYSTVIAGYARIGNDVKAIELYKTMLDRGVQQNFGSLALLIRIVAQMERKQKRHDHILVLSEAEQVLEDVMVNFADYVDLSSSAAPKSAIPPWIFTPLMSIYTKHGAINRSLAIFEKFVDIAVSKRPQGAEPNLYMFELMMAVYQASGQVDAVQNLWKSLRRRARRYFEIMTDNGDWQVLPQNRQKLCPGLRYIMQTYVVRQEWEAVDREIENLAELGYELDNVNWNDYIQAVCQSGDVIKAVLICEKNLMNEWETMRPYYIAASQDERKAMVSAQIKLPERRPFFRTLETIASTLKQLSDRRIAGDIHAYRNLEEVERVAPATLEAVESLANLNERIQKDMMYRMQRQAFRGLDYTDTEPPPQERQMGQWDEEPERTELEDAEHFADLEREYLQSPGQPPELSETSGERIHGSMFSNPYQQHFPHEEELYENPIQSSPRRGKPGRYHDPNRPPKALEEAEFRAKFGAVKKEKEVEKFLEKTPQKPLLDRELPTAEEDSHVYQDNWSGRGTKARVVYRKGEERDGPIVVKKKKYRKPEPAEMEVKEVKEHMVEEEGEEEGFDAEYQRLLREQEEELLREMRELEMAKETSGSSSSEEEDVEEHNATAPSSAQLTAAETEVKTETETENEVENETEKKE
ncbi:TPR-like protein [Ascodesmis nigricans]|uniref:TPR-like protein n=1 Tax=Ascodesmis nigricans TaxID=341454 RepID=A0A4S2MS82_9PEZI|nr:TPR-like protein [Ascodesmis nigricans]